MDSMRSRRPASVTSTRAPTVADPEHAEGASDRVHLAEAREKGFEPRHVEAEHLDVDVLRAHSSGAMYAQSR